MQNLELKAELRDPTIARAAAMRLGAAHIAVVDQTDTCFRVPHGRLKRRETAGEPTEYIFYHRRDEASPRISQFTIYDVATARERFGLIDPPVWVIVRKRRQIFMYQNVRIHLDEVEGLGTFLELEALISAAHDVERCQQTLARIREAMQPALGELIAVSYADLLAAEMDDAGERSEGGNGGTGGEAADAGQSRPPHE
jgi:adenylate cyclase, class 2